MGNILRRLVDSPSQIVGRLELRFLRGHQPQDHRFSAGNQPQGSKSTGSLRIVLEQKCIHFKRVKQLLGDGVVATLGEPAATAIAAANVRREGYPRARQALK